MLLLARRLKAKHAKRFIPGTVKVLSKRFLFSTNCIAQLGEIQNFIFDDDASNFK